MRKIENIINQTLEYLSDKNKVVEINGLRKNDIKEIKKYFNQERIKSNYEVRETLNIDAETSLNNKYILHIIRYSGGLN